ncbi:MAG: GNAT family N-acetyltransferase [Bacteroidetes bacterium]|nr:GNAT family N-acetyltransferase [Bacteroidota bacterium]
MSIHVTTATQEDLPDVAVLFDRYRVFYRQSSDLASGRAFLETRLAQGDSLILLARTNEGAAAGFTQIYPTFSSVRMARLWILNDLYVDAPYRQQGVASALLDGAVKSAQARGVGMLLLETEDSNITAQRLYQKHGWTSVNGTRHYELSVDSGR